MIQALAAMSLFFVSTVDHIWIIYVSTFVLMSATAIQLPTRSASISTLVKKENLLKANSLHSVAFGIVMVIGSMLGGFVTAAFDFNLAFVLNALTLVISAFIMMTVKFPRATSTEEKDKMSFKQFRVLIPIIKDSRLIKLVFIYYVIWAIGGGIINLIPSVFAFEVYQLDNIGVGILYACFGIGQILGGYISEFLSKWTVPAIAIGFLLEGVAYIFFSVSPNIFIGGLMLVIALAGVTVGNAFIGTLVMEYIPEEYLGRLFSIIYTAVNVILGTTMIVAGILLSSLLPQQIAMLSGLLITIPSLIIGYFIWRTEIPQTSVKEGTKSV